MRPLLAALLFAALLAPQAVHAADSARTAFAFPATPAGRHAEAWFAAYHAGEDALRAFWTTHGSAAALAQRPVEPRLQFLRQVRGDQGELTPVRVLASTDDACEVLARAEHGGALRVRFECESDAAHALEGMQIQIADDAAEGGAGPRAGAEGQHAGGGDPGTVGGPHAPGAPPSDATPPGPPPTDAQIVAAFGAELDSLARRGEFSGVALLDKDGVTLLSRAFSMSLRVPRRLNTLETRFNLGSLNKIVTHVAIEQLAQAGKLRLDDTLGRYLPDYRVAGGAGITLRMLLDHRGGVPDMFGNPAYAATRTRTRTTADWYALVRELPLEFAPGTRQQYSNGGFVLLGKVIEKVSGEDYYDYVRRHVYEPAGMTHTGHLALDALGADAATGYTRDIAPVGQDDDSLRGWMPNTTTLPGRGSSAGGGYATAGDLVRFAQALRAGRLLDAEHVRDVFGEHFALGIAGGSPGVNALFVVVGPYTLVVLANFDPPTAERFAPTVGRMLRRAAGVPVPVRR